MARGFLWAISALLAAAALVAGCVNVDVPRGPYVVANGGQRPASPADENRVRAMDRPALEQETLRLTAENDYLRRQVEKLKRDNKELDNEKDQLENRVERLEDQIKDMRKR